MKTENPVVTINSVRKQFLNNVSLCNFHWQTVFDDLTPEKQELLLNYTVNDELVLKYPVKLSYQKAFVKYVIERLEGQGSEIHDLVYEAYARLVALPSSSQECFKHYEVKDSNFSIVLKENVNLISEGTTGLRTWQASLALCEWSLKNKETIKNKKILELGSGIGLTGLIISLYTSPKSVYFTDCHTSVLTTLCDNLKLNIHRFSEESTTVATEHANKLPDSRCLFEESLNSATLQVLNLPWEDVSREVCQEIGTLDVVLAADIVYDADLFAPLINALDGLSKYCLVKEFVFACTERNHNTLMRFLEEIGKYKFVVDEIGCPEQENFVWPADPPVRMFKFSRN